MNKILLITPFIPSNIGAGVNYTRLFIEDISKDCKVDIVLCKSRKDKSYIPPNGNVRLLREFNMCTFYKFLNCFFSFFLFPLFTAKFSLLILLYLKKCIRRNNYDYIYFDFSQTFLYARLLKHENKIFMAHDVITQRYSRNSNALVTKFCFLTENWILHAKNITVFTFSKKDSNLLSSYFDISSIPTSFYLSKDTTEAEPSRLDDYFVFFAMWRRVDNYEGLKWFYENIIPLVSFNVKIKVIGAGLSRKMMKLICQTDNIQYLGFVDNPYPIISNAKALISPLFTGAGVKVKVIEALACGTPVIGTEISFEGIDDKYSKFMLSAKSPGEFVYHIENLNITLEDRLKFKEYFISNYSSKSIIKYIKS